MYRPYIAPKSKIESRAHYAPEPAGGSVSSDLIGLRMTSSLEKSGDARIGGIYGEVANEIAEPTRQAVAAWRHGNVVSVTRRARDSSQVPLARNNAHEMLMENGRLAILLHSNSTISSEIASRKDATLLAQLRSGYCIRLRAYKQLVDNTVDPNCPRCARHHRRWNTSSTAVAL